MTTDAEALRLSRRFRDALDATPLCAESRRAMVINLMAEHGETIVAALAVAEQYHDNRSGPIGVAVRGEALREYRESLL